MRQQRKLEFWRSFSRDYKILRLRKTFERFNKRKAKLEGHLAVIEILKNFCSNDAKNGYSNFEGSLAVSVNY